MWYSTVFPQGGLQEVVSFFEFFSKYLKKIYIITSDLKVQIIQNYIQYWV